MLFVENSNHEQKQFVVKYLLKYSKDGVKNRCKEYKKTHLAELAETICDISNLELCIDDDALKDHIIQILNNYRIIESSHLSRLIQKIYVTYFMQEWNEPLFVNFTDKYKTDISDYRNKLAHAEKSDNSNEGFVFVDEKTKEKTVFDSALCNEIRKSIILYKSKLHKFLQVAPCISKITDVEKLIVLEEIG